MKTAHVIGILALVVLLTGIATAQSFDLSFSNTAGATDLVAVHATYEGTTITVWATDKTTGNAVRIDEIAFNLPSSYVESTTVTNGKNTIVYNVVDNSGKYWDLKGGNSPYQISSAGQYLSAYKSSGSHANRVIVTLKNPVSDIPNNGAGFEIVAHVAWGSGSAFFAGPCTSCTENPPDDTTQIPEFPSIALPVAAIIGLIFISQSRRRER